MNKITFTAPDMEEAPPRVLREKLQADETLLWWSRGRGPTFDPLMAGLSVSVFGLIAFDVLAPGFDLTGGWPFVYPVFLVSWTLLILPGILIGARYEIYGLTNRRVIFIPGLPPAIWYGLGRDGGSAGAIHLLTVSGTLERGNIRLQSAFVRHYSLRGRGIRLTGIERPLEIGHRIKSALQLNTAVEDRTRPLPVHALKR